MANMNEIVMTVRWKSDDSGNGPDFTPPAGCAWQDITGQPAADRPGIPVTPNVYLIRAWVTDAVYTAINGDTRYIILARRQYDDATPDVDISNNFDSVPTGTQLNTLKNAILTRYPDVDEDKLTEAGRAVFRAELTRAQIIGILAARWARFLKAIT